MAAGLARRNNGVTKDNRAAAGATLRALFDAALLPPTRPGARGAICRHPSEGAPWWSAPERRSRRWRARSRLHGPVRSRGLFSPATVTASPASASKSSRPATPSLTTPASRRRTHPCPRRRTRSRRSACLSRVGRRLGSADLARSRSDPRRQAGGNPRPVALGCDDRRDQYRAQASFSASRAAGWLPRQRRRGS